MDGRNPLVKGYYRRRADAILKCALVALRFGYLVFAVQHQGWCATGPRAQVTYRKYGRSNHVFQGSLLVIVTMIDGSEKRNCEGGF